MGGYGREPGEQTSFCDVPMGSDQVFLFKSHCIWEMSMLPLCRAFVAITGSSSASHPTGTSDTCPCVVVDGKACRTLMNADVAKPALP